VSSTNVRRSPLEVGRGDDPAVFAMRLYIQYLQGLFNWMPEGTFHWEPDDEITEIMIRGQAPLNTEVVGKRPAITVVMGPYQFAGIGIDNLLSYNPKTGARVRTDLMSGYLVVYTIADSDIIAMRLAHIVAHHTRVNQRLLESPGGFYSIARPSPTVNSPSPPGQLVMGDPGQLIMCQVNIPFQMQWTWETSPKQQPQFRSLGLITDSRRASEYEFAQDETVSNIRLAMNLDDVRVRRLRGPRIISQSNGIPTYHQPVTEIIHEGTEDFQISGLEAFQEDTE
jgi:hypothetical protein